jgi:hypothetical protein
MEPLQKLPKRRPRYLTQSLRLRPFKMKWFQRWLQTRVPTSKDLMGMPGFVIAGAPPHDDGRRTEPRCGIGKYAICSLR